MAVRISLTLHEGNDETIQLTITPITPGDDLTLVTELELLLKPDQCTPDGDPLVVTLSSTDPSEITITGQTATEITADAFIPAAALASPYDRWWRVDALNAGGDRRTAMYGPVEVINL